MLGIARRLRKAGVLGLNGRNVDYLFAHNDRSLHPLVNDKLQTKALAERHGVATPPLYGVIRSPVEMRHLRAIAERHGSFVIKPAHGAGGDGIVVIDGLMNGGYRRHDGIRVTHDQLAFHVSNVLSGMYSLGGHPDSAFLEYKVRFDPVFENISYLGVPDLRIAVYRGVPVMAMARLPTCASKGKANLHKSGVGLGIDLAAGVTTFGVMDNRSVDEHPDTGQPVSGIALPCWDELLETASRAFEMTGLGLLGVDLVLDWKLGPLVLELNARPGLSIQIANRQGLRKRLEAVDEQVPDEMDAAERIAFARRTFAEREPQEFCAPRTAA